MSRFVLATMGNHRNPYSITSIPDTIVLRGRLLSEFKQSMPYFEALDRWEGHKPSYTLTAKRLFDGDQDQWDLFVRLFFPQLVPINRDAELFVYNPLHNDLIVNETVYSTDDIEALLDYLLVPAGKIYSVMKELKELHKWHAFTRRPPLRTDAVSHRSHYDANLALTPTVNEDNVAEPNEQYEANNETEENTVYRKLNSKQYRQFLGPLPKSSKRKTKKKRGSK